MRDLAAIEMEQVCGGNAQDTVYGNPAGPGPDPEPGLGFVPWFGIAGGILLRFARMIF